MTLKEIKESLEKAHFKIKMYQLYSNGKPELYAKAPSDKLSRLVAAWQITRVGDNDRAIILQAHVR